MNQRIYEAEVLSVSAGDTYDLIITHGIHACPHYHKSYNYKPSEYITFRKSKGGEMEVLYKIKDIIFLNPHNSSYKAILKNIEPSYAKRIESYISERFLKRKFSHEEEYRFYILSDEGKIELKHAPMPKVNNTGSRYYTLSELTSGKKIVEVESKL